MIREVVARSERGVQREPAFVTAPSKFPAEEAGLPSAPTAGIIGSRTHESLALTHFDDYTNVANLLIGTKRWLLLPPDALRWEEGPRSHSPNERLDVSFDSHPELPWRVAEQRAGDCLVVPAGWWHRVASSRDGSAMVNIWCN